MKRSTRVALTLLGPAMTAFGCGQQSQPLPALRPQQHPGVAGPPVAGQPMPGQTAVPCERPGVVPPGASGRLPPAVPGAVSPGTVPPGAQAVPPTTPQQAHLQRLPTCAAPAAYAAAPANAAHSAYPSSGQHTTHHTHYYGHRPYGGWSLFAPWGSGSGYRSGYSSGSSTGPAHSTMTHASAPSHSTSRSSFGGFGGTGSHFSGGG